MGEGKHDRAERIFSQTAAVIVVLSVLITIAVAIFAEPLAALLGAGPQTIGYSAQYLHVVCLFSLCFILSYCLEVMVKVDGAPHLAMFGVGISFLINVGLDYLFIMVWHWGVFARPWPRGWPSWAACSSSCGIFCPGSPTCASGSSSPTWAS